MDSDIEQAGALATAGLAAAEIDRGSIEARVHDGSAGSCANCGSVLTGRFCSGCGQAGHLHRSLLHLLEELVHSVLHFDAKGWRTLPLLIARPGVLTRRYIDGMRTRYVSPLALFLFMSFLMFFIVSLTFDHAPRVDISPKDRNAAQADLQRDIDQAKGEVERAGAAVAEARRKGGDVESAEEELSSARTDQQVAEAALRMVDTALSSAALAASASAAKAEQAQQSAQATGAADAAAPSSGLEQLSALKFDTGHPKLDAIIHRQLSNPELFLYRLENTAYKYLFMLIPISLPFLWLMFVGKPGVTVYDHAVFSLYSLSFMSLLITGSALLGYLGMAATPALLMVFVPPLHMFLQLRGTYRLGIFSALWRTAALIGVAGTAFTLFMAFIVVVSLR
jgi:uncharacterized protein DUF3667